MKYMEEREWRIVRAKGMSIFTENGKNTPPDYFLKYIPGSELYTVVLPDGYTVNAVMQNNRIRKILFAKDTPQVSILSLEDIGTF